MKEIGGYIEFETYHGKEYHSDAIALNSGRHCLAYLIESLGIQHIWIPYYLCSSIKEICTQCGVNISYYRVKADFTPNFDFFIQDNEYLFVVNYYGQLSNEYIKKLSVNYPHLIVDNTQAFFQMPVVGVHTLYSCRKFFGVPDGGYLYTDQKLKRELPVDISYRRMNFLLARFETNASDHYHEYVENNALFRNEPLKKMSKLTHNLMKGIDYDTVKNKREENFSYLHEHLKEINLLSPTTPIGPYCYPFMIKEGSIMRRQIIEQKIYIPQLWPEVLSSTATESIEYRYTRDILPLPCDQRYGIAELEVLLKGFVL